MVLRSISSGGADFPLLDSHCPAKGRFNLHYNFTFSSCVRRSLAIILCMGRASMNAQKRTCFDRTRRLTNSSKSKGKLFERDCAGCRVGNPWQPVGRPDPLAGLRETATLSPLAYAAHGAEHTGLQRQRD